MKVNDKIPLDRCFFRLPRNVPLAVNIYSQPKINRFTDKPFRIDDDTYIETSAICHSSISTYSQTLSPIGNFFKGLREYSYFLNLLNK